MCFDERSPDISGIFLAKLYYQLKLQNTFLVFNIIFENTKYLPRIIPWICVLYFRES